MSRFLHFFLIATVATIAAPGCRREEKKPEPPPPLKVLTVVPQLEKVTEFEEFTGRTAATEIVELRSRVSGYLSEVNFSDGELVPRDKILFRIDDRPFAAEEQRAMAAVAQIQARIRRLENQLRRAEELREKNAISQNEFETAQFDLAEATAALHEAEAAHRLALLNLQFTVIKAPIAGRIGRNMVDAGNLVITDQTALATIIPQDQIHVYFDIDERTVLRLRRQNRGLLTMTPGQEPVRILISLADAADEDIHGTVDFLDNQVDPSTGTLRARATVLTSEGWLTPGLFVRLKFPLGQPEESLLIPEEAMASDQGRPFVYVVRQEQDKCFAEAKSVEPGPLLGSRRVIRSGLLPADQVIVTGLQRLRQKTAINPSPRTSDAVTEPSSERQPASR